MIGRIFPPTAPGWSAVRAALVGAVAIGGLAAATGAEAAPRFTTAELAVTVSDDDDGFDRDGGRYGAVERDRFGGRGFDDGDGDDRVARGPRGGWRERGDYVESQWGGPPYGNAWGHRRKHWRDDRYGWGGPPRHWQRCRTVWERRYDPWRGWSSYPVRRCW